MAQKTVLIVDDSSLVRLMVQKIFSQYYPDWKVIAARQAEEGLSLTAQEPVHLALIDYNMPGMNGIEMAVSLLAKYPHMSVHLVTANIQQKMQERAAAAGIGFIKKPLSKDKIDPLIF